MNKSESKYFNTAVRMDEAFLSILSEKDFDFITVKEICARSGVNRSTFYLHYETVGDLLLEAMEYINQKFQSYFEHLGLDASVVHSAAKEDLIFIKPEFLIPWLQFIRDNKLIYSTVLKKYNSLQAGDPMFEIIYRVIFFVMGRYGIPEMKQKYMIMFYLEGMNAIIKQWLRDDCKESIDDIVAVIEECVRPR